MRCSDISVAAESARSRSPHEWGSLVLGPAVSVVSIGPQGHHDHPPRDPRALASGRLPSVLALEIPLSWRPTVDCRGSARVDPTGERGKSAVGCAAHPWRAAQARLEVAQSSVAKYMGKRCGPPSQGWCIFLRNHAPAIAAMDLFVVPTIGFDLLYVLVIVRLARRDLVWINVTPNPTAEWIARQITEAFPWAEAPRYLIRDRDRVYGTLVTRRLRAMGIRDKPIAPGSPWQNGLRRKADRIDSTRVRRPCDCLGRSALTPDSDEVFRLLQRVEDTSVSRQRHSDPSRHSSTWAVLYLRP